MRSPHVGINLPRFLSMPLTAGDSPHVLQGVWQYSVDKTGQKHLMIALPEQTKPEGSEPLQVIVSWVASMKTR